LPLTGDPYRRWLSKETGKIVDTVDEMATAVSSINLLNRKTCRETALKRFDVSVIAGYYLCSFPLEKQFGPQKSMPPIYDLTGL